MQIKAIQSEGRSNGSVRSSGLICYAAYNNVGERNVEGCGGVRGYGEEEEGKSTAVPVEVINEAFLLWLTGKLRQQMPSD